MDWIFIRVEHGNEIVSVHYRSTHHSHYNVGVPCSLNGSFFSIAINICYAIGISDPLYTRSMGFSSIVLGYEVIAYMLNTADSFLYAPSLVYDCSGDMRRFPIWAIPVGVIGLLLCPRVSFIENICGILSGLAIAIVYVI